MSEGTNTPYGFIPIKLGAATAINFAVEAFYIDPTLTQAIYQGDPVQFNTSTSIGSLQQAGSTQTQTLVGIFAGCSFPANNSLNSLGKSNYFPGNLPSGTQVVGYVYIDPNIVYKAQMGGSNPTFTLTNLAQSRNCNYVIATSPTNPSSGISNFALDGNTFTSSATTPFKVLNITNDVTNVSATNAYGVSYCEVECKINQPYSSFYSAGN